MTFGLVSGGLLGGAGVGTHYYLKLRRQLRAQNRQLRLIEDLYGQLRSAAKRNDQHVLESIESLVRALEARDTYTRGHSDRVNRYSLAIGQRLGLSAPELAILNHASLLHDIGKIGVYDRILLKPKALTKEEFSIMKSHPVLGAEILESVSFFKRTYSTHPPSSRTPRWEWLSFGIKGRTDSFGRPYYSGG